MAEVIDLELHDNGLPRRLDEAGLKDLLAELLRLGGRLSFVAHLYHRMEERDITAAQIEEVLRRGDLISGPTWSSDYRNWKFTMTADTAGERVTVGAAIDVEPLMGQVIVVITVF